MTKSILIIGLVGFVLAGCASGPSNYQLYADTQAKIAQANAVSDTARYNALLEIAKNGDSAAKVAAVLSIQMNQMGGTRPQQQIAPPEDWDTKLLKWAGILVPTMTQLYGIHSNKQIAVTQSNNAAATAQSTNNTFAAMSNNMATSNTNIAKAGFDAVSAAGTALTNVATAGLTANQNTALAGFNNSTVLGTAGITGVNAASTTGITGINTAIASGNTLTNNIATGYTTALQSAIAKLTGTTTTTTTTTTVTNNVPGNP